MDDDIIPPPARKEPLAVNDIGMDDDIEKNLSSVNSSNSFSSSHGCSTGSKNSKQFLFAKPTLAQPTIALPSAAVAPNTTKTDSRK